MAELTQEELNGLRMGVVDLYRLYCPENAFDDREFLIKQKKTRNLKFSLVRKEDIDFSQIWNKPASEDFGNTPSLHEDSKPFEYKNSKKQSDVRFSLKNADAHNEISNKETLRLLKDDLSEPKQFPDLYQEPTVTDEEVAEHKRKRLAEEAKARTASTYQKLEMLPTAQTAKTTSRDRLVEKRSKEYSLFERIGFGIDKILGKEQPKSIQYTEDFNKIPLAPTFSDMLTNIIKEKDLKNSDVYKNALMDRRLFSKIISNQFHTPSRETVFCLILALKLDFEEASDFMAIAGFAFRRNNITDVVIEYFIRTKNYDIFQLNQVLNSLEQQPLASRIR